MSKWRNREVGAFVALTLLQVGVILPMLVSSKTYVGPVLALCLVAATISWAASIVRRYTNSGEGT